MGIDVEGQVVLVTGANRGIGRAIVESLLAKGASKVYGAVRSPESLVELQDKSGDRLVAVELDLTKPDTITAAAESAGDVQIVINNAGVLRLANALSATAEEDLRFEFETNVVGLLRMASAFAPILKANGGGAFVQLNSVVSLKAFPQFATYSASKAAAYSLTQSLKSTLGEQGTEVVSVHPGPILTDMGDDAGLTEIAEPPELVATAIIDALANDSFHAFAGTLAGQIGEAYQSFAAGVVEGDGSES